MTCDNLKGELPNGAAIVVLGASGLIALFHEDFARVGLWTGSIYAVGMLIILLAPSTGGKKLED